MSFQLREGKTVLSVVTNMFLEGSHLSEDNQFQDAFKAGNEPWFLGFPALKPMCFPSLGFCFVELNINSFERDWLSGCAGQALTMAHESE